MFTFHHVLLLVDFSSGCQALTQTVRRMVEVGSVDATCYTRSTRSAGWEGGMRWSASCGR